MFAATSPATPNAAFKLFERQLVGPLFERQTIEGYVFDAELCLLAHRRGLTVVEVPVRWTNDPDTRLHAGATFQVARDLARVAFAAWRTRPGGAAARLARNGDSESTL